MRRHIQTEPGTPGMQPQADAGGCRLGRPHRRCGPGVGRRPPLRSPARSTSSRGGGGGRRRRVGFLRCSGGHGPPDSDGRGGGTAAGNCSTADPRSTLMVLHSAIWTTAGRPPNGRDERGGRSGARPLLFDSGRFRRGGFSAVLGVDRAVVVRVVVLSARRSSQRRRSTGTGPVQANFGRMERHQAAERRPGRKPRGESYFWRWRIRVTTARRASSSRNVRRNDA